MAVVTTLLVVLVVLAAVVVLRRSGATFVQRGVGGQRFVRRASQLNQRLAAVISQLEFELRARDREIARLRAELRSKKAPPP